MSESIFQGNYCLLMLTAQDAPLKCAILDIVDEFDVFFYKVELDSSKIMYINIADVSWIEILGPIEKKESKLVSLKRKDK